MTFEEIFVALSVLALAGYALHSMRRAARHTAAWRSGLRDFAQTLGLAEGVVDEAPGEFGGGAPVTWKNLRQVWSRNPAIAAPSKGSAVFTGSNCGFPFVMDEVWIRKWWTSSRDAYLRMSVELPELPDTLEIAPGHSGSTRSNLRIRFSTPADDRAEEQSYLTARRLSRLQTLEETLRGVYIYGGRLFAIVREDGAEPIGLHERFAALGQCAHELEPPR